MKLLWKTVLALAALVNIGLSQSVTYYVDAAGGNDSNDGRTPQTAWQTLAKINARTFFARDSILLKSGSVWTGQLKPKGSGRSGQPIVIDRYGDTTKPCINGGGVTGQGTVYLNNQEYWEINNLEITNDSTVEGDRRGVNVTASNFGTVHHIYLRNLYIHNVKGIVDVSLDAAKRTGGIGIETTLDNTPTRYDDILIEGCTIAYCENTGLYTANLVKGNDDLQSTGWLNRRFTNVRIRNNRIHHISKNAMILRLFDHGVVEYNVCYETALQVTGNTMFTVSCDGTVFQYNEGSFNRATENTPGGGDGSMYDADLRSSNIVFQYSYSHDNSHGLFWNCTVQSDSGVVCRYNVSQNDKGIIFCVNYAVTSAYIYNNTVYIGAGLSPVIISERNNGDPGTRMYSFYNNIIYNLSANARYDFRTFGYTRTIDYNVFYGNHPSNEPTDPHKITGDPLFVSPGTGGTGFKSIDGYKLQASSPCIDTGFLMANYSAQDLWGNTVPSGTKVDRGAFEYPQGSMGVNDYEPLKPGRFALKQNYPNPFNPGTIISYGVPSGGDVQATIYNTLGEVVRTLRSEVEAPGDYAIYWNGQSNEGRPVASGPYFCMVRFGASSRTIKMLLVK